MQRKNLMNRSVEKNRLNSSRAKNMSRSMDKTFVHDPSLIKAGKKEKKRGLSKTQSIKYLIKSNNGVKKSGNFDSSTRIGDEFRPNEEYYGSSGELAPQTIQKVTGNSAKKKLTRQSSKESNDRKIESLMKRYRDLQLSHKSERIKLSDLLSQQQFHRLTKMQQIELKKIMQQIIKLQESAVYKQCK